MDEKKKITFWDAVGKLSFRDKAILFIAFVGTVTALVGGLFFFMLNKTSLIDFKIPVPELRGDGSIQSYKQMTYSDLDILVQFPGTNCAVYTGKEGYLFTDYAASFQYDKEKKIVTGVFDKVENIADYYNLAIPSVIEEGFVGNETTYTSLAHREGYLNTSYLIYDGGTLNLSRTYYLLSYLYEYNGKYLFMGVVFEKPSKTTGYLALSLLDKVYYTLSTVEEEDNATDSASSAVSSVLQSQTIASGENIPSTNSIDISEKTATELINENMKEVKESAYRLEYPNATDLEDMVYVDKVYEGLEAVIYIWFSEADAVPDEAWLTSPNGIKYAPTYSNENGTGMVYFTIRGPKEGYWTIHLSANIKYGYYSVNVLPKDSFTSLFIENANPVPRGEED